MSTAIDLVNYSPQDIQMFAVAAAKSGFLPGVKNDQEAFTLMMLCQAEGLHPMTALKRYHIIEGRPSMRADAMQAEFQKQGGIVEWIETTPDVCRARFIHPVQAPKGLTIIVTLQELMDSGVAMSYDKANNKWRLRQVYKQHPAQMLRARCISQGVRAVLPGVIAGIYTPEEEQDRAHREREPEYQDVTATAVDATPAPRTPAPRNGRSQREQTKAELDEAIGAKPAATPPPTTKLVGLDRIIEVTLQRWNEFDPAPEEAATRAFRIKGTLINHAVAEGWIGEESVTRPSKDGKTIVKDQAKYAAVLSVLIEDPARRASLFEAIQAKLAKEKQIKENANTQSQFTDVDPEPFDEFAEAQVVGAGDREPGSDG